MENDDLTPAMQELMAQMAQMKAELTDLKQQANVIVPPQSEQSAKPVLTNTRRKALRRLAGGLLAGLTVTGGAAALPGPAKAQFVAAGGAGAVVMPPGGTVTGSLPSGNVYGLISTADTTLALSSPSTGYKVGLYGLATGTEANVYGVFGQGGTTGVYGNGNVGVSGMGVTGVFGTGTYGVYGIGTGSGSNYGVVGNGNTCGVSGNSTDGNAVIGTSVTSNGVQGTSTSGIGVSGTSTDDIGVKGVSTNYYGLMGTGSKIGTLGFAGGGSLVPSKNLAANTSLGMVANAGYALDLSTLGDNSNCALFVIAGTASPGAARTAVAAIFNGTSYFFGDVHISGQMNGAAKFFKIDHPLDPANKYLNHASVESPEMKNVYDGVVTLDQAGTAWVELPEWFEVLNSDYRYQLTGIGQYAPVFIAEEIADHKFKLAGGLAGQRVSWMVTGIRRDAWASAHPIQVEEDKTGTDKGKYLHPEEFGEAADLKIGRV